MPIRDALRKGIALLNEASVPSSELSAELLLLHALGRNRTWLYTHSGDAIASPQVEKYLAFIARRASGEPAQYIVGKQEFWGLDFEVTPDVLIPRPETEHVIEVALEQMGGQKGDDRLRIADVGTGSGCIAIALAKELPNARIVATDISTAALAIAKRNAARHEVADRIQFVEADILEPRSQEPGPNRCFDSDSERYFRLIVSNPPYIANSERPTLQREVREHEPEIALFGGQTGVEIYPRLIRQAESWLLPHGALIMELGYGAAERVRALFQNRPLWNKISISDDLAGVPRVLAASFA